MKISVVVPVYNSSKILFDAYKNIINTLEKITSDYEILFRNDGSKDKSADILQRISEENKQVRIFSNPANKGLGFTLRRLFADANGDPIVYLDADAYLSFDLSTLPIFLKMMQDGADVVIASRYKRGYSRIPFYRIFCSKAYSIVARILFKINIKDIGSGFVVFKKKVLKNINLKSEGFDIHIEMFTKIKRDGFKIKEVAVPYKHWHGGSFNVLKHGPKTLVKTLKVWHDTKFNK